MWSIVSMKLLRKPSKRGEGDVDTRKSSKDQSNGNGTVKVERRESARLSCGASKFLRSLRSGGSHSTSTITKDPSGGCGGGEQVNVIALKEFDSENIDLDVRGQDKNPVFRLPERSQSFQSKFQEKRLLVVTSKSSELPSSNGNLIKIKHSRAQSFLCNSQGHNSTTVITTAATGGISSSSVSPSTSSAGGVTAVTTTTHPVSAKLTDKLTDSHHRFFFSKDKRHAPTTTATNPGAAVCTPTRAIPLSDSIIYENLEVIREQKSNVAGHHMNKNPIYSTTSTPQPRETHSSNTYSNINNLDRQRIYSPQSPINNNCSNYNNRPNSSPSSMTTSLECDRRSSFETPTSDYMTFDSILEEGESKSSPGSKSQRENSIKSMSPHDKTIMKDIQRMSSKTHGTNGGLNGGIYSSNHIIKSKDNTKTSPDIRLSSSSSMAVEGRKLRRSISEVPSDRLTTVSKLQTKTMDNARALYSSISNGNGLSIWNAEKSCYKDGHRTYGILTHNHHPPHHGSLTTKNFPSTVTSSSTLPRRSSDLHHNHHQFVAKSTPSLKNVSEISLDTCLLNGHSTNHINHNSSSSISVNGSVNNNNNCKKINNRILPTISSARSTPNLPTHPKQLSHINNTNSNLNNCLNHIYDSPKLIQDQLRNSRNSSTGVYSTTTNHNHGRQGSFPTEKHPGLLRMKNFENSNENVYENSSRPITISTNAGTNNNNSNNNNNSQKSENPSQKLVPNNNNNNNMSNNGSSWSQNAVLAGSPSSPLSGPAVRDSSSLKQIRYGPGHEKYPSWPIPVSSAAQIDPVGELSNTNCISNSGSSRSKSWTESTDYPKEKVPSYARPYMKRMNQSYTQQLKTVMEKCERIPPETFEKLTALANGGQRQMNGSCSLGILPPPVGYRDMYNGGSGYNQRLPKENDQLSHGQPHGGNGGMMIRGPNINSNNDKEYNIPSPPERDNGDQGKPFTQEDVELYAKKYEEMMNQYAHSEGYHSYISSECSSYISSGTPFLDQLRRESENQQFWPGDSCDPNDPLFGLVTSGRESVTTVVTNSSSNSSGTETLKWHGSTSDLSLTSGSGGSSINNAITPRMWEQQQQHHNNNAVPQKHPDSAHMNGTNSSSNGGLRHIKNKLDSQPQTALTKGSSSASSGGGGWGTGVAADGPTPNLKKFPLSTYIRPTTLLLTPDKQFTAEKKNKLAGGLSSLPPTSQTNIPTSAPSTHNPRESESGQNQNQTTTTSPIIDTSKPPSVAERIMELEQQSSSSSSSTNSQNSTLQTKIIQSSSSSNSLTSTMSTSTTTLPTTNNHIISSGNHLNEKFGKSSSLTNLHNNNNNKAQPQQPHHSNSTSHHNNNNNNNSNKSSSQLKKGDNNNTNTNSISSINGMGNSNSNGEGKQKNLTESYQSTLWNNFNESNNNHNNSSPSSIRSSSTDPVLTNGNSNGSSNGGPISYTYLDPEKKQKVSDMTLKAIQKKALLSYYERHTGKSTSSSSTSSSSDTTSPRSQLQSSSSSSSTTSSTYNNSSNKNESQVNNNNSNLLEKDSPFPSNRLTLSLPRDIDRIKDHHPQAQHSSSQQQQQQQFEDGFLRRDTTNRSSSDESSRSSSHSSMTSSVASKQSPSSPTSVSSSNMDRGDCERHAMDDISSSNSARNAYISKYLPHLVHNKQPTSPQQSANPAPPERPPKKPHLRGISQQTMDNGKNSCPPPPLPRAPVRQQQSQPNLSQLDSLPPPVPTKSMMSIPRCQSPDLPPPPPPPVREEEALVFNNDDPLPPPPTINEVHNLVGVRSHSTSGLSSYKDSYLAARKERTLGYEGRYRRTLSPSGLGSKSQTEVSPNNTPPHHHHPMSNSTSTGKLDSTLSPSAWEKYHNIRAPSTTVIFTSNEISKSTASSQPLFHRSISWESNLFNNKTGFSQSSIPPPVAQVAPLPLRGASNEVNHRSTTGTLNGTSNGVEESSILNNNHHHHGPTTYATTIEHNVCGGGGGGSLKNNCASLNLKESEEEETMTPTMMSKSGVVTGFVKRSTKDSHCQISEAVLSGSGMETTAISLTVSPLRFQSGLDRENKENIPMKGGQQVGGVNSNNNNLKKSEITLRVNCLDASSQTDSGSNSSNCSNSSGSGKEDEGEGDVMMRMGNEPTSFISTLEDGEVLVKGLLVPSISSSSSTSISSTTPSPIANMPSSASASSYIGRQKSHEELECEVLSRDLAKQLPQGDKLQSLLVPLPKHKTPADYMEGLFPLELKIRADNNNTDSTKLHNQLNMHMKLSPAQSESNFIGSGSSSPSATAQVGGSRHESDEESAAQRSAPLPADSAYFTTSECKAKFLTQYVNDMNNESISRSRNDCQEELIKQKEELVSRISRKLEILRTEQLEIRDEIQSNEHLGQIVIERVKETAKRNEFDKFKLHVEEIEKITSLLLGLSGRLARAENALMGLAENSNPQEKKILESKRDKLKEQLDEAKILKENIDRRSAQVSGFLVNYLTAEEYADYHHFVKMKAKLIIDSREIDDKLKLGVEQMKALEETLSSS